MHRVADLADRFLRHLFERRDYERAASYCPQLVSGGAWPGLRWGISL